MAANSEISIKLIHIKGLVQGVGFRPFVYRIAIENKIKGWVDNRNDGVHVKALGSSENMKNFLNDLKVKAPLASTIKEINITDAEFEIFEKFEIVKSKNISEEITEICPDIAVCKDCLNDLKSQPHRIDYPFINCTNCGPRFTIIKDLPYDRDKTTMQPFEMCPICKSEYKDILDRRFHAQPVACNTCGPTYNLSSNNKEISDFNKILDLVCTKIDSGEIVALKGIGGFFIACDALNENVVTLLRERKNRESKPLAVMFRDIESAKEYAEINENEVVQLTSWQRPIILLKLKKNLAYSVTKGLSTIGIMLPYMPIHFMMFEKLKTSVIVLTSGNISDDPIIIENELAKKSLQKITDTVVTYNREIYNRADDSVVSVFNKRKIFFRRSRGYVPSPIDLNSNVDGIIATGAELSNTFCIGKGNQAIVSQHIGDLKNLATLEFYKESILQFQKLFRVTPKAIVSDLHPNYLSSQFAIESGIPHYKVQHHHAHIASCMAEHKLNEMVIGVSFDGTGLGTDNNIWGGEFFICNLIEFKRFSHFEYVALPGGDKASKESWRMGLSYLYHTFGKEIYQLDIPLIKEIGHEKISLLLSAIDKKINSPLSSSAGRLFDAVAAITNICTHSAFQAEAPIRLESVADKNISDFYDFEINETIRFSECIKQIVNDVQKNISVSIISAKFHNTVVEATIATILKMKNETGINKVCLSGGTFQNRILAENIENRLIELKIDVFVQQQVPPNDGGISLGQLIVGANMIGNI